MVDPDRPGYSAVLSMLPAYSEGIELFNREEFWHAHEAWEACWLVAVEPERTLLQGLIQTAAALVQLQRGNRRGLIRNWFKARPKLVAFPTQIADLDLAVLIHRMDLLVDGRSAQIPRI